jgi:hypothetical protein
MNEGILLFDLTTLPLKQASCVPDILQFRKQKGCPGFQIPLFEKGWTIPHEKCPFLLNMDYLDKKITKVTPNFSCRNQYFVSIE